ncbi:MAG: internal scaffolding protein [Microviridae sp.]|nr:MAG: internal scaffolding protein [Microviridae sp.]
MAKKDLLSSVATPAKEFDYPLLRDAYIPNGTDTGMGDWEPSLTRQEFAEDCDINVIMARYENTGVISHTSPRAPMYIDLTDVPDFRAAMDMMIDAEKAFMSLPAKVRKEFDNDARSFVDFAQDPENLDQMRSWGLAPPAPQEPPKEALGSAAPIPPAQEPPKEPGKAP